MSTRQYNILYSLGAKQDLQEIYNFIASNEDDNYYAQRVVETICSHCTGLLSPFPSLGKTIETDTEEELRMTVEKTFRYCIHYEVLETQETIFIRSIYKSKT